MRVPFTHAFSCDWASHSQKFISEVCSPQGPVFADMLKRNTEEIPYVDVYVCGFPCTPYSTLRRHKTRLMKDPAAKPFWPALNVVKAKKPATVVLENVLGLAKVMNRIVKDLKTLKGYYVSIFTMDPKDFGEPISRPRYYFLCIREDRAVRASVEHMEKFITSCLKKMQKPVTEDATAIMLPNSDPEVCKVLASAHKKRNGRPGVRATRSPRWRKKHAKFAAAKRVRQSGDGDMAVTTERGRDAWSLLKAHHGARKLVADVSQSIERAAVRTDGCLPTITPKGCCCVGDLMRPLIGAEKLLVHGFPLHKMSTPRSLTHAQLGNMGGNTMHLMSVGFVMLVGLKLVVSGSQGVSSDAPAKVVFVGASNKAGKDVDRKRRLPASGSRISRMAKRLRR
jgi:site-specific DNA-cytosine methylase